MRTIALGLLLATAGFGARAIPAFAAPQDQDHPHHEGRPAGDHPHGGGRPGPQQQAPAPQGQPPAQVQAQARAEGGFRGGGYRGGGAPGFQPQAQQQQPQGFQRPDRGNQPQGFDGRRQGFEGRPEGFQGRPGTPDWQGRPQGFQGRPQGFQGRPQGFESRPQAEGRPGNPDWQGRRPDGGPQVAPGSGGYRPQPGQYGYRPDRGPNVAPGSGGYRPQPGQYGYRRDGDGYRPAPPRPGPGGSWNRGWRDDRSYDYRSYRVQNNVVFRLSPYFAPRGWGYGYRRFSPGFTLSGFLFDQDYWIDDPYEYRLPPAWGPYRWVRYYNDALLVDVRSGVVVDAVYGIFWQ